MFKGTGGSLVLIGKARHIVIDDNIRFAGKSGMLAKSKEVCAADTFWVATGAAAGALFLDAASLDWPQPAAMSERESKRDAAKFMSFSFFVYLFCNLVMGRTGKTPCKDAVPGLCYIDIKEKSPG